MFEEAVITKRLLQTNAFAIFVSNLVHVLARYIALPVALYEAAWAVLHIAIYSFIFAYVFEIANQTNSSEEDRLNKPSRPIPSGLLSINQAYQRWFWSWFLSLIVMHRLYGRGATVSFILWQFWLVFCYVWPKYDHWLVKNAFTGVTAILGSQSIDVILSGIVSKWKMPIANDVANSLWLFLSIHMQDFTEVKGDRAANRKTLPIILSSTGMRQLRATTAVFFLASSLAMLAWGWIYHACHPSNTNLIPGFVNMLISLVVATRTLLGGSSEKTDRVTYFVYYYFALFTHMIQVAYVNLGEDCLSDG